MTALVSYSFSLTGGKTNQQKIQALLNSMTSLKQVAIAERHYFANGIYAREITIPKGVTLVGAVHKTDHLCTMSAGHLVIDAGDGNGVINLIAPCTFESKAWSQKAATALEETTFTTYHATHTKDVDELVEELTTAKANEVLGKEMNKQLIENKKFEVLV
jgi:hypothetical protein